jgi:hypothetical protein
VFTVTSETRLMSCCVCRRDVYTFACTSNDPEAPDMFRAVEESTWFGVVPDDENKPMLVAVCSGECLKNLMSAARVEDPH